MENAVPLNDYITSIPVYSLPRILKISSGVYLQSSIYDIAGSECCLSTGDLLKVVGKELLSVCIVDIQTGKKQHLQKDFKGVFQVSVDNCVYDTFGDLHKKLCCKHHGRTYWFTSETDFTVGENIIKKLLPIQLYSTDRINCCGECYVFEDPDSYYIKIPLPTKGKFYEWENKELYTLEQILQDPGLSKQNFRCTTMGTGTYRLCPEYEIKTIMQMRKGFVKMPSSLEVDVIDITDYCGNITFIQPLSLTEIYDHQQKFPVIAEILDATEVQHLVKNDTYSALQTGQKIIIYKKMVSKKVLATGIKNKTSKFFYIYDSYQGKFRLKPREFDSVFELWTKTLEGAQLDVVVTQDFDSGDDNCPSLCTGDHLQVLHHTKTILTTSQGPQEIEVIVCSKGTVEEDDEDDDDNKPEEVLLPIYMKGKFVEEVKDTKKYKLFNAIQKFKLPCDVKVVAKDTCLSNDPLSGFLTIRLEEIMEEPALCVSLYDKASECFEMAIKYFNITVVLLEDKVSSSSVVTNSTKVEELTECFYYNLRKDLPSQQLPPPRPPKRAAKADERKLSKKPVETKQMIPLKLKRFQTTNSDVLTAHHKSPSTVQRNVYSTTLKTNTKSHEGTYSDHDYEQLDEQIQRLNISPEGN